MQELFETKEGALVNWCKKKGYFSSHEVNFYGTNNFYDSATRRIREMCEEGKVRRLSKDEALFRGFKTKCAIYEWIKKT